MYQIENHVVIKVEIINSVVRGIQNSEPVLCWLHFLVPTLVKEGREEMKKEKRLFKDTAKLFHSLNCKCHHKKSDHTGILTKTVERAKAGEEQNQKHTSPVVSFKFLSHNINGISKSPLGRFKLLSKASLLEVNKSN